MQQWKRKRQPDDVPTPVAVAVSDFCRRAKGSAHASVVREALALLAEEDDFRVRELADAEPAARPLGPFAVVDVINGADPELAAKRQESGYYELAQALTKELDRTTPLPVAAPAPSPVPVFRAPFPVAEPASPEKKTKKDAPRTMAEKIAPLRRPASELPPPAVVEAPLGFPRRELPAPRGRFTQVEPSKQKSESLLLSSSREYLQAVVEQSPHRVAVRRVLDRSHTNYRGGALSSTEVDEALTAQGLMPTMARRERESLFAAPIEQRGSVRGACVLLEMNPAEFKAVSDAIGATREVDEIRERFVREALSSKNLSQRLDMLGRSKYLDDLKIGRKFNDALGRDLKKLLDDGVSGAGSLDTLVQNTARKHGLNPELLKRAMDRLGLSPALEKRLSA